EVLKQVITSKNYALMSNYPDIFSEEHEFNKETLLEIQYATGTFAGETITSPRNYEEAPSEAGGWYECYPNQFLFDEMSNEKTITGELDPRLIATIGWKESPALQYGKTWDELLGDSNKLIWRKYSGATQGQVNTEYSGQ